MSDLSSSSRRGRLREEAQTLEVHLEVSIQLHLKRLHPLLHGIEGLRSEAKEQNTQTIEKLIQLGFILNWFSQSF